MDNVIIYDKLEELNEGIESNGGGIETLLSNALLNAGSVVKSVQRGKTSPLSVATVNSETIPISAINLSKSVLIINYMSAYDAIDYLGVELYQNYIHLTMNNPSGNYRDTLVFSWQVVEFY